VPCRAIRTHANEFVFLMAARGAHSIAALHERLYTRSLRPHLRPEFPYEPHITLARQADPSALELAFDEAKAALQGEYADVMRDVNLLGVEPDGRIEALGKISLHSS